MHREEALGLWRGGGGSLEDERRRRERIAAGDRLPRLGALPPAQHAHEPGRRRIGLPIEQERPVDPGATPDAPEAERVEAAEQEERALVDEERIVPAVDDEVARQAAVAEGAGRAEPRLEAMLGAETLEEPERRRHLGYGRGMDRALGHDRGEHRPVVGVDEDALIRPDVRDRERLQRRLARMRRTSNEPQRHRVRISRVLRKATGYETR